MCLPCVAALDSANPVDARRRQYLLARPGTSSPLSKSPKWGERRRKGWMAAPQGTSHLFMRHRCRLVPAPMSPRTGPAPPSRLSAPRALARSHPIRARLRTLRHPHARASAAPDTRGACFRVRARVLAHFVQGHAGVRALWTHLMAALGRVRIAYRARPTTRPGRERTSPRMAGEPPGRFPVR